MARMVTAYDTRTGEALPNPVPQSWLDRNIYPHLSATAPTTTSATVQVPDGEPTDAWTVPQLRAHAERRRLDLGGATTKADILTALTQTPKES